MPKKLRPIFESEAEVPAELKDYYVQDGTQWVLVRDNDEVASFYNPSLAANRDRILGEKRTAVTNYEGQQAEVTRLRGDVERLTQEAQRAVGAGKKVVTEAEVAELEQFKLLGTPEEVKLKVEKLGKFEEVEADPEKVKTGLAERTTLSEKTQKYERDTVLREAADNVGPDRRFNFSVLSDLITHPERGKEGNSQIAVVMEEVDEGEGTAKKKARRPFVIYKGADNKDVKVELGKYADERTDWQPQMPSLNAAGDNSGGGAGGHEPGKRFIGSAGAEASRRGNQEGTLDIDALLKQQNEERNTRPSPLRPAATT